MKIQLESRYLHVIHPDGDSDADERFFSTLQLLEESAPRHDSLVIVTIPKYIEEEVRQHLEEEEVPYTVV